MASAADIVPVDKLRAYVERFNADDEELYPNDIPNRDAVAFLADNIPRLECPDGDFERTYYFRWWTYRKHIKNTADGHVITEFLPDVPWAGRHNTISCAAGHHFYEGRWLHDGRYLDAYARFWFRAGNPRRYSTWLADALYARHMVAPDARLITGLLDAMVDNFSHWEERNRTGDGLFHQIDDRDGMEMSIGGSGYRPTINAYMFGDALAISRVARLAGQDPLANKFQARAEQIRGLVQSTLWDEQAKFFKVLPMNSPSLVDVREQHGYTPWYFNLPERGKGYEAAWKQLMDVHGFFAPFGPTTAEQRHPRFKSEYTGHECQWNGASWPYATSVTLTALANLLNDAPQDAITRRDYFETLRIYTHSHQRARKPGKLVPWIDENLNPLTGEWLSREMLRKWKEGDWDPKKGGKERGKDYNHSTYNDLIITGLIGLRPRADDVIDMNPLLPEDAWEYFCLDRIRYHGRVMSILWDRTGEKYRKGPGLRVLVDGSELARSATLARITARLDGKR